MIVEKLLGTVTSLEECRNIVPRFRCECRLMSLALHVACLCTS